MAVPAPDVSVTISPDLLLVGGVDDVTLTCSTSINRNIVDSGELRYSFIWIDRDGSEVRNSSRTVITSSTTSSWSTLTLSPLKSVDTFFRCNVTITETQNTLQRSDVGTASVIIDLKCKLLHHIIRYQFDYYCLHFQFPILQV